MKKELNVKLVREFSDEVKGENKLVTKEFKYEFSRDAQELITNGEIEEIYFVVNTLLLHENEAINNDDVEEEYNCDIMELDEYSLPKKLCFFTDIYVVTIVLDDGLLKDKLKELGFKEFEACVYIETTTAKMVKVLAKDSSEVSDIIYGPSGDNIYEILEGEGFEQVHYEHGVQDIKEV